MPTTNPSAARGQTKPFIPKFNPPELSRIREMVWPELYRRIRASLTIVPLEKLLEATLGDTTFKLFKTWTSEISEQDWLADKDIKDYLKRYCTATPETSRYAPLVALNNRLLEYAQGKLQGVKDLPKLENSAFCFLCSFTYSLLVLGFGADRWQYRLQ